MIENLVVLDYSLSKIPTKSSKDMLGLFFDKRHNVLVSLSVICLRQAMKYKRMVWNELINVNELLLKFDMHEVPIHGVTLDDVLGLKFRTKHPMMMIFHGLSSHKPRAFIRRSGGHSYLLEPLWWAGMITMITGEVSNFAAYAYAPAILVTPLGAVSIIVSAGLAHVILKEKLHALGFLGCVMCLVGSVTMVLHAPKDRTINSVQELWELAIQTDFLVYVMSVFVFVVVLIIFFVPHYGRTHVIVCISICSLVGSLTVMSVKAVGMAIKLTFEGDNQFFYPHTWLFVGVVVICGVTQLNYLNKALDAFDTAVVSLIYYVMFTSFTILASVIMFKNWQGQAAANIISEMCGFLIILSGMTLLLATKGLGDTESFKLSLYSAFSPSLLARLNGGVADFKGSEQSSKTES